MEFKVLTLHYSAALGVIDDAPLTALDHDHEILGIREHFFVVREMPHLLCLVNCRRRLGFTSETVALPQPEPGPEPVATSETDRSTPPTLSADLTEGQT